MSAFMYTSKWDMGRAISECIFCFNFLTNYFPFFNFEQELNK